MLLPGFLPRAEAWGRKTEHALHGDEGIRRLICAGAKLFRADDLLTPPCVKAALAADIPTQQRERGVSQTSFGTISGRRGNSA